VISSSQRPLPENTQHLQQNIYAPGGIWTHNLSRRAAADLSLRPRGHWVQPFIYHLHWMKLSFDSTAQLKHLEIKANSANAGTPATVSSSCTHTASEIKLVITGKSRRTWCWSSTYYNVYTQLSRHLTVPL
jgi:hypothetical protein